MKTLNKIYFCILILTFTSCIQDKKSDKSLNEAAHDTTSTKKEFGNRFSIVGDFNGDKRIDTIYESYISSLTKKETYKKLDAENWDRNQELIVRKKPVARLYTSIPLIDTFIVTDNYSQMGLFYVRNLGDINDDDRDEIGYAIAWIDDSNLNTYHILTLEKNKFKEIFSFHINESVNFEPDQLFDNSELIKKISNKTIKYKFYSDSATVETGEYRFK